MFATAVLPVSFREPQGLLTAMLTFLSNFDTSRVVLLHVTGGAVTSSMESRLEALRDELYAALGPEQSALEIDYRVRAGSPAFEIALTAQEELADFIYFPWKQKNWRSAFGIAGRKASVSCSRMHPW